ncbi:MAG: ATP-binding cassette domain-containing protein, partial [Pseudomonadota bacterium]
MTALLEVRGLTKIYGHITANEDVDLKLQAGEIHCVLGENGAGKSTLMRCIYGAERAQQGDIYWQGQRTELTSPKHARSLGIGMVFQNFSLINELTVADNLLLYLPAWDQDTTARINTLAAQLELNVDLNQTVGELSAGQKQHVELLRVLLDEPQLVILDEPTSMLTAIESHALQRLLKDLSERNIAILLITHKLDEALNLADNITILRRGRSVATLPNQALSKSRLGALLVGEMDSLQTPTTAAPGNRSRLLACEGLDYAGRPALQRFNLSVHAGEIVGIGGIAGNGQETLNRLLIQASQGPTPAELHLDRDCMIGFTPEDRETQGCAPTLTLMDNLLIGHRNGSAWISHSRLKQDCQSVINQFNVVSATPES